MVPELLEGTNHVVWFKAGEEIFSQKGIQYLGVSGLINAHSIIATLIVQVQPPWPSTGISITCPPSSPVSAIMPLCRDCPSPVDLLCPVRSRTAF